MSRKWMLRMGRLGRQGCWAVLLVGGLGCRSDAFITAPQPTASELAASVTDAAAAALDQNGKFRLTGSAATIAPQVSSATAIALARAYTRQFAPLVRDKLESEHGGHINLISLTPCGRPLYAVNAFEEPPLDVLPAARRSFGPWWFITMCEGGSPKLSVSVSAWATELKIEGGRIQFPPNAGMELFGYGIPAGHSGEYPRSPERAAYYTATETGRRVVSVPALLAHGGRPYDPRYAKWQWRTEASVTVRTRTGDSREAAEFFAGGSEVSQRSTVDALFIPSAAQPDSVQYQSPPPLIVGESQESYEERVRTQTRILTAKRKVGLPILFEEVLASGAQQ